MTPLAHGNGLDELAMVLVPLAIVIVLLRIGAKRSPPEEEPGDEPRDEAAEDQQVT